MLGMTQHKTSVCRLLFPPAPLVLPPLCGLCVLAGITALLPSLGAAGPTKPLPATVAVTDLGTLGGSASSGYGVNNSGQVAGTSLFGKDKTLHACLWQNGKAIDLGTLGGQDTVVYAINHAGQIAGGTNPDGLTEEGKTLGDSNQPHLAFVSAGGKLKDLNSLIDPNSGRLLTEARSISDQGYVTGTGIHGDQVHAFLLKLPPVF
jgi:probable HAF family extracellular repeat protein